MIYCVIERRLQHFNTSVCVVRILGSQTPFTDQMSFLLTNLFDSYISMTARQCL